MGNYGNEIVVFIKELKKFLKFESRQEKTSVLK